jgi:nucleoside-diphosphate-sugar epimerase
VARILIAGCGDLGTAAGALLVADGHEVFGVRRRAGPIGEGIIAVSADMCEASSLQALPVDVETLIYTAAADGFSDDAYERAYVTGLRNVLSILDNNSLRRVIFVSSTSVYAQDDGGWVDEGSATVPTGFSGQRLLQAEAMVNALDRETSVVRFGGIYGPGRTRLIEQVRAGASCIDEPVQWTNRIHRDDCAAVMHHLALLEAPAALYLGVDSEPAGQCAVLRWLAHEMAAPEPLHAAARDASSPRRRGSNKRCSNRRLLDSGYPFIYPSFRDGYSSLLCA